MILLLTEKDMIDKSEPLEAFSKPSPFIRFHLRAIALLREVDIAILVKGGHFIAVKRRTSIEPPTLLPLAELGDWLEREEQ